MNKKPKTLDRKWFTFFICLALFHLLALPALHAAIPSEIPSLTLTQRQLCDLELIMNGGFSPLKTFMGQQDYERVVDEMRLADGTVWPMPIILDIKEKDLNRIKNAPQISLRDQEGFVLALMTVNEIWQPNKDAEAKNVYGTTDKEHPGVQYLFNQTGDFYVSGELIKVKMPQHFDFVSLRRTPADLKKYFKERGITRVVAFQTRNPMHRAHLELTLRASENAGATF